MVQSFHPNFDPASSEVITTVIAAGEAGKHPRGRDREIRPGTRRPQNAMMRLAVLNALRPATCYSRF
jgi:hypothetical protein